MNAGAFDAAERLLSKGVRATEKMLIDAIRDGGFNTYLHYTEVLKTYPSSTCDGVRKLPDHIKCEHCKGVGSFPRYANQNP